MHYTVSLNCKTKYNYNSVEEIPFVKGLNAGFKAQSKLRTINRDETLAVKSFIRDIEADAHFGDFTDLTVDVVIVINKNNPQKNLWKMYYQDGVETTLYDINVLSLDYNELYNEGLNSINDVMENYKPITTRGYSTYDRFAARDYARKYSSNPTAWACYDCGKNCGNKQDRTAWNNDEYKYFDIFKHSDCADFVSQAMSAGGLKESGEWYRKKNVTTKSWGTAWTTVKGLKTYMTNSSRNYWDVSSFAKCNAGNILLTSDSHVVMVDFNDGTTHKFTGHTNDRKSYVFGNVSTYKYYVINRS